MICFRTSNDPGAPIAAATPVAAAAAAALSPTLWGVLDPEEAAGAILSSSPAAAAATACALGTPRADLIDPVAATSFGTLDGKSSPTPELVVGENGGVGGGSGGSGGGALTLLGVSSVVVVSNGGDGRVLTRLGASTAPVDEVEVDAVAVAVAVAAAAAAAATVRLFPTFVGGIAEIPVVGVDIGDTSAAAAAAVVGVATAADVASEAGDRPPEELCAEDGVRDGAAAPTSGLS